MTMSDHRLGGQPWNSAIPYAPRLPAAALAGVRSRRIFAVVLDLFIVSLLSCGIWLGLGFLSLGLLWFVLPPLFPIVAFFYNGLTISGRGRGTPGRRSRNPSNSRKSRYWKPGTGTRRPPSSGR
jgi:hypothetical protein